MKSTLCVKLTALAIYFLVHASLSDTPLQAQPSSPVESGKQALQRENPFPWYDQPQDKLKRIPLDTEWMQRLRDRMEQLEEDGQNLEQWLDEMVPEDLPENFDSNDIPMPDMEEFDFDSESFMKRWSEYLDRLEQESEANSGGSGQANPNSPGGDGDPSNGNLDPSRGNSSSSPSVRRTRDWTPNFEFAGSASSIAQFIFWGILIVLIIGVIALIVWAIINREKTNKDPGLQSTGKAVTDEQRLEALPVQLDPAYKDLLDRARQCYDNGDYNQAIIYLFSYELMQLDRRQLIRLTRGKTNHQYLREVSRHDRISDYLSVTIRAFEDVFFGNHDLSRNRFQQCWDHVDIFRSLTKTLADGGVNP